MNPGPGDCRDGPNGASGSGPARSGRDPDATRTETAGRRPEPVSLAMAAERAWRTVDTTRANST